MLNCKQVATQASDYLDKHTGATLQWKIRLHLMMCANCRRFMRHLKITKDVAATMAKKSTTVDAVQVLKRVKQQIGD